jgi:hypothetical protein
MVEQTVKTVNAKDWMVWLIVVASLLAAMLYLYYVYPHQNIGPKQPIYFSHRVHANVKGISCRFCHPFVEQSTNPGIPAVGKCLFCHSYIVTKHPQIVNLRSYFDTKTPIPWVKLMYIPDHCKFNHQPHIKKQIDCTECHGEVKKMDRIYPIDYKMGFCIECHKARNAQLDCWLACHQ